MACCGPSIPKMDKESLLKDLRKQNEEISLDLKLVNMTFEPKKLRWTSNILLYFIILIFY